MQDRPTSPASERGQGRRTRRPGAERERGCRRTNAEPRLRQPSGALPLSGRMARGASLVALAAVLLGSTARASPSSRAEPPASTVPSRSSAALRALRFRSPAGQLVQASHTYEIVSQHSIYQESYLYGEGSVREGSWNVGPLQYLYQRLGDPAPGGGGGGGCAAAPRMDTNIPGADLRLVPVSAAPTAVACAAVCEQLQGCEGYTYDCCNNSRAGSAGCYLKSHIRAIQKYKGDVSGCSGKLRSQSAVACDHCGRILTGRL